MTGQHWVGVRRVHELLFPFDIIVFIYLFFCGFWFLDRKAAFFMMCYWVSYMVVLNSVLYRFVIHIKQHIIPLSCLDQVLLIIDCYIYILDRLDWTVIY